MKCTHILNSGSQCGAYALDNSELCISHDPRAKDIKQLAVIKGGKALKKPKQYPLEQIPINDKKDVIPFMVTIIDELRSGKVDVKKANALAYIGSTLLKAFELVEMEERISKIETLVLERKTYKQ